MPTQIVLSDTGSKELAAFVPVKNGAGSAKTWTLLAGETGTLDPLIIALARASDRVGPAKAAGQRPTTAS